MGVGGGLQYMLRWPELLSGPGYISEQMAERNGEVARRGLPCMWGLKKGARLVDLELDAT